MTVQRVIRSLSVAAGLAGLLLLLPSSAEAQSGRRGGGRAPVVRGPAVRTVIYLGPYPYRYSRFWYDSWYQWGPYYPYPYGYRTLIDSRASVRIQVTPREADVFVDGYRAGQVDDFDGVFQRLHLRPGGHEITIFLDGYETVRERIYMQPGAERRLQFAMNRLRAGERSEPPPAPSTVVVDEDGGAPDEMPAPVRTTPDDRQAPPARETPARFGTLSLRIQPADAEILVDGERWTTSSGEDRIAIQLSEGRHRIEVRRDGFTAYREDVLVRRGATLTLNVVLSRT